MSAHFGSSLTHGLVEAPGYVRVEFGYVTVTEISALFRALAVTCVERQVTRVLIIAGDDEPAGERSLRNALTTMILAGIPDDFRLALVTALPRTAQTYRNTQRDFNAAGIKARLFGSEDDALLWLESGKSLSREDVQALRDS